MQVTFELNEELVRKALETQVSRCVSDISETFIRAKVEEILATKFERLTPGRIEELATKRISDMVSSQLSSRELTQKIGEVAVATLRGLR